MTTRFGYLAVASKLVSDTQVDQLIADYVPGLDALAGRRWQPVDLESPLPLCFFVLSGGTEGLILEYRQRRSGHVPHEPVLLLAHPGNNSLPASLEVLAKLQQDGQRGRILYLRGPHDQAGFQQIGNAVRGVEVFHALRQARIGMVGAPSDWLVASSPSADTVKTAWGPQVVPIDLAELHTAISQVPTAAVRAPLHSIVSHAVEVCEPSQTELQDGVRVYLALKDLIARHRLSAITVRCFDVIQQLKTTGCFGLAQLNDDGVISGCEGDLVSTVGMLWVHHMLDQIPWMANPAQLDETHNSLWLAHCTVPRGLVHRYRLRSHFESGMGVGVQGDFATGPVTLLRIGGKAMDRLWLAEGQILRSGHAENLCRTQVEIQLQAGAHVGDLLGHPLGNHLVLVMGHHQHTLRNWWETYIAT